MSVRVMNLVWEHSQAKGTELLLLLSIADNANDDGIAWPGYEYLARKMRMSKRGVEYVMKRLLAGDELRVAKAGARGRSNVYQVEMQTLRGKLGWATPVATQDDAVATQDHGEYHATAIAPEPPMNPQEPSTSSSSTARDGEVRVVQTTLDGTEEVAASNGQPSSFEADGKKVTAGERRTAEEILAAFNQEVGASFRSLAFLRKIVLRIREHPEVDVDRHRQVIRFNLRNPWWSGVANPSVIYGSASLFESLLTGASKASPEDSMTFGERLNARRVSD